MLAGGDRKSVTATPKPITIRLTSRTTHFNDVFLGAMNEGIFILADFLGHLPSFHHGVAVALSNVALWMIIVLSQEVRIIRSIGTW